MVMESRRYLGNGRAALSAALLAAVLSVVLSVVLSGRPASAAESVLTPSPQTVQVGETIGLSFTGFKTCPAVENLTVRWDNGPLPVYDVVTGPAGSDSFTADAVVPSSPFGLNQIDAGCSVGTQYFLQEAGSVYVVALTPSVQVVQAGGSFSIAGSGFTQCTDPAGVTTVELSVNGTPLATVSGSNGDFQQVITVPPATLAGPYPVTAQCSAQPGNDLATTSVSVVTLALLPSSGPPGTTISVTGGGYAQCREIEPQLLRDATQSVAAGSPARLASGSFTAQVTVPASTTPGNDYQVDAACYPGGGSAPIAIEPFTVTPASASGSPTPNSSSASPTLSSTSPSPARSGAASPSSPGSPGSPSPSPFIAASPQSSGHIGSVALIGGIGAGLALLALLLVRTLSMVHGRRSRGWVHKHLRVVAGRAGPLSADVERRPGATPVSVGLEPHLDHLGNQQYEEAPR